MMMQTLSQQNTKLLRIVQRNLKDFVEIHKRTSDLHRHLWPFQNDDGHVDYDDDDDDGDDDDGDDDE